MRQMKEIKLCDDCQTNPPKVFVQLPGSYKLICTDCSGKNRYTQVEQWVDFEDEEVIEAF